MNNTKFSIYGVYAMQNLHKHNMKSVIDKDDIEHITKDVFLFHVLDILGIN